MENNNKEKRSAIIKKIIFYISLMPYIFFLGWGIFNCIIYIFEHHHLDLYELIKPVYDFWSDAIFFEPNPFYICLILFCLIYPTYYLIDKSNKKASQKADDNNAEPKVGKSFVLYLLSFIPYLHLICACFAIFITSHVDLFFVALLVMLCYIPVYPVVIIFQIVYFVKKHKSFTTKQKKINRFVTISILLLILFSILVSHFILKQ